MIDYTPLPVLMTIGQFHIYTWGFILSIAFIIGLALAVHLAKKKDLNVNHIINLAFITIISGIVFAHLGWLVENHPSTIKDIVNLTSGLAFFPGFLAAILFSWLYIHAKKLNFWKYADVFAVALPLSHAIARIGCFLNWDDYGKYTTLPWAIKVANDIPRHPTQLYHVLANLVIFGILFWLIKDKKKRKNKNNRKRKKLFDGALFLIYIMLYSIFRFIIEFWRDNPLHFGLTASQWFCILGFIFVFVFMKIKKRIKIKRK